MSAFSDTLLEAGIRIGIDDSDVDGGMAALKAKIERQLRGRTIKGLSPNVDDRRFASGLSSMQNALGGFIGKFRQGMSEIGDGFSKVWGKVGSVMGGILGAQVFNSVTEAVVNLGRQMIQTNTQFEQYIISLGVMLKSKSAAAALIHDVEKLASETPFETAGLIKSVQLLKNFGYATKDLLPMLRTIGDAAAAAPEGMEFGVQRISLALGQMKAAGKLMQQDLMQLTNVGVPGVTILQEAFHKSFDAIQKDVQSGAIAMDSVIAALLAGMKSRFGGMMQEQSQTFAGLSSTLKDNLSIALRDIGKPLFDLAKLNLSNLVNWTSTKGFVVFRDTIVSGMKTIVGLLQSDIVISMLKWGSLLLGSVAAALALSAAFAGIAAIASFVTGPMLIAAGAIAAMVPAAILLGRAIYKAWNLPGTQKFLKVAGEILTAIRDVFAEFTVLQADPFASLSDSVAEFITSGLSGIAGWLAENKPLIVAVFQALKSGVESALSAVKSLGSFLGGITAAILKWGWPILAAAAGVMAVKTAFAGVVAIIGTLSGPLTATTAVVLTLGESLRKAWSMPGISRFIESIKRAWGILQMAFGAIIGFSATNALGSIFTAGGGAFDKMTDAVANLIDRGLGALATWLDENRDGIASIGGLFAAGLQVAIDSAKWLLDRLVELFRIFQNLGLAVDTLGAYVALGALKMTNAFLNFASETRAMFIGLWAVMTTGFEHVGRKINIAWGSAVNEIAKSLASLLEGDGIVARGLRWMLGIEKVDSGSMAQELDKMFMEQYGALIEADARGFDAGQAFGDAFNKAMEGMSDPLAPMIESLEGDIDRMKKQWQGIFTPPVAPPVAPPAAPPDVSVFDYSLDESPDEKRQRERGEALAALRERRMDLLFGERREVTKGGVAGKPQTNSAKSRDLQQESKLMIERASRLNRIKRFQEQIDEDFFSPTTEPQTKADRLKDDANKARIKAMQDQIVRDKAAVEGIDKRRQAISERRVMTLGLPGQKDFEGRLLQMRNGVATFVDDKNQIVKRKMQDLSKPEQQAVRDELKRRAKNTVDIAKAEREISREQQDMEWADDMKQAGFDPEANLADVKPEFDRFGNRIGDKAETPFKTEMVGIEDLGKRIQDMIGGGSPEDIAKQQLGVARDQKQIAADNLKEIRRMADKIEKVGALR